MAGELQERVLEVLVSVTGATPLSRKPDWLQRPDAADCGSRWPLVCEIYRSLTGLDLPMVMPPREWRRIDGVIQVAGSRPRIVEVDEAQHFNAFRARTLECYHNVPVAFDVADYMTHCGVKCRLEGGDFGKPKPPLFPGEGGRHRQRAFRDALADIVPLEHGYAPTLRIAHFEVESWIFGDGAERGMECLLAKRPGVSGAE